MFISSVNPGWLTTPEPNNLAPFLIHLLTNRALIISSLILPFIQVSGVTHLSNLISKIFNNMSLALYL